MNLEQALKTIGYDSTWGIWAEKINGKFSLESPARFGQQIFENGGLLDDKEFVCDGEFPTDWYEEWCKDREGVGEWDWEFADTLLDQINDLIDDES